MMKPPGIFHIISIGVMCIGNAKANQTTNYMVDRSWVPERLASGEHTLRRRFYAAWLVFTGRADVLTWTQS